MKNLLFVISDLHLGGAVAGADTPSFQMCSPVGRARLAEFIRYVAALKSEVCKIELLINGDFVDFLAEAPFEAFTDSDQAAEIKLTSIMNNNADVFDALRDFVTSGNRLTIALGNHDIELSLPGPRAALSERLGAGPVELVYDNQALSRGPVLIEHGNRYDSWNAVEHSRLREVRSCISRNERGPRFLPPAGSELVVQVMNKIKKDYPFIDLLKPENEAALPILAVLAPKYFKKLQLIVDGFLSHLRSKQVAFDRQGAPLWPGYVGAEVPASKLPESEPTAQIDQGMAAVEVIDGMAGEVAPADAAAQKTKAALAEAATLIGVDLHESEVGVHETVDKVLGFLHTFRGASAGQQLEKIKQLHRALRRLAGMSSDMLCTNIEHEPYLTPVKTSFALGHQVVVYGHTHLLKRQDFDDKTYINTGTWADLILIPEEILDPDEDIAFPALYEFTNALLGNQLCQLRGLIPSFARIEYDKNSVGSVDLMIFHSKERQDVVSVAHMKDLHAKHPPR